MIYYGAIFVTPNNNNINSDVNNCFREILKKYKKNNTRILNDKSILTQVENFSSSQILQLMKNSLDFGSIEKKKKC